MRRRGFTKKKQVLRFYMKFDRRGERECWPWHGTVISSGYGRIHRNGRMVLAHRMAWHHFRGPIPKGLQIHHTCENRLCMNPQHMRLMTAADHKALHWRLAREV